MTAVEVRYEIEQVADGCFDEGKNVCFHGNLLVGQEKKQRQDNPSTPLGKNNGVS
jgi:hypothetical protein